MLNYLITVTENTAVTAMLLGLIYAYIFRRYERRGRNILNIGTITGFAGAAAIAVLKNTTKFVDNTGGTGMMNIRIFAVSLFALLVYYAFAIKGLRRKLGKKEDIFVSAAAALLAFTFIFYAMPDVMANPFTFSLNGESVFSAAFFSRFIGWLLGLILSFLIFLGVYKTAKKLDKKITGILLGIELLINGLGQAAKIIQVLLAKRIVSGHMLFVIARHTSNHSCLFIYAAMIVAVIAPLMLWIGSFNVKEPYENPAEHRKIRAKWRNIRRWSTLVIVCFALAIVNLTAIKALDNREIELSPAEECEVRGDAVYVPLTQVGDGHLHRFEYTTKDNITVRFIVIKKPNSQSYGVGLDACDICGETGYFERSGQIVCKLCDVVMNINTIGFKGGCNPIVIDYSVENGYIIVPVSTLEEHQNEFK